MTETSPAEIQTTLQEILSQMTGLAERVARLERSAAITTRPPAPAIIASDQAPVSAAPAKAPPAAAPLAETSPVASAAGISEEELIAISAAVAAYLGVRAHIRQVRVIHSSAWAQQGRVSVQASHRLSY